MVYDRKGVSVRKIVSKSCVLLYTPRHLGSGEIILILKTHDGQSLKRIRQSENRYIKLVLEPLEYIHGGDIKILVMPQTENSTI